MQFTKTFLGAMIVCVSLCSMELAAQENEALPGFRASESDLKAIEVADAVMEALGGRSAWDHTRYVSWRFFDRRNHWWDKWTGDVRIVTEENIILMNIHSRTGRAWSKGEEIVDKEALSKVLKDGYGMWVNDSYWVFMPYKLKDSGVALKYKGERPMKNDQLADVLELTFESVGLTPKNRYEVLVDKETKRVGEWLFFGDAGDEEPRFNIPWLDWHKVGDIMLAGSHGRDKDWKLAAYRDLPRSVFTSPSPVKPQ